MEALVEHGQEMWAAVTEAELFHRLEQQLARLRHDRLLAACYPESTVDVEKHVQNIQQTLKRLEHRKRW